jgi:hypothetical protein
MYHDARSHERQIYHYARSHERQIYHDARSHERQIQENNLKRFNTCNIFRKRIIPPTM